MADATRYNRQAPAVKRILQEAKELASEESRDFHSEPLEDNIFEWHFAIQGPPDTEFAGGIFHGRIQLPPEYPFKPPTFSFLTPNGRFEVNTKICLSISQHHPEHWQPSWSVRTALIALIAFLPTKADGAIGAIEYSPEERRSLAAQSRLAPPTQGQSEARAAVTRRVHAKLLESPPAAPATPAAPAGLPASDAASEAIAAVAQPAAQSLAQLAVQPAAVTAAQPAAAAEADAGAAADGSPQAESAGAKEPAAGVQAHSAGGGSQPREEVAGQLFQDDTALWTIVSVLLAIAIAAFCHKISTIDRV